MNQEQAQAFMRFIQEQQRQQQVERVVAARQAAEHQQAIDEMPRQKYAVIVAVDNQGGFSKDGVMPWHFPQDLKWFKERTEGHICVMGRKTYETITRETVIPQLGDQPDGLDDKTTDTSALPNRRCFVISTTVKELPDATVVKSISDVANHLTDEDFDKTIFLIGGERIFREGIALADTVYVTAMDHDYQCDKFFPTDYLMEHFYTHKVYKREDAPELRFTTWKRNTQQR